MKAEVIRIEGKAATVFSVLNSMAKATPGKTIKQMYDEIRRN